MAKFPSKLWFLWIKLIVFYGNRGLWHAAAPAVIRKRELTKYFDTLFIDATCPHCDHEFTYRHADIPHQERYEHGGKASLKVRAQHWLKDKPWFTWIAMQFVSIVALRYPWFKHIRDTVPKIRRIDTTFLTGCPQCNRCVRLEWEIPAAKVQPVFVPAQAT